MYYDTKHSRIRSSIVLIVIFLVGVIILGDIQSANSPGIETVKLYYYNSLEEDVKEGQMQCSTEALLPIARVTARTATTTDASIRKVLDQLLYTELNPIEESQGFTRVNIPNKVLVSNFTVSGDLVEVLVTVPGDNTLNECEERLLTSQIQMTLQDIQEVSTTTVELYYR